VLQLGIEFHDHSFRRQTVNQISKRNLLMRSVHSKNTEWLTYELFSILCIFTEIKKALYTSVHKPHKETL
jgi:hypothetical protein